jgi:hypothetical protein
MMTTLPRGAAGQPRAAGDDVEGRRLGRLPITHIDERHHLILAIASANKLRTSFSWVLGSLL